jgi:hypothetical protein
MFTVMTSADVTLPDESTLITGKGDADYVNDAAYSDWEAVGTAAEFQKIVPGGKYYLTADIDLTGVAASKKAVVKGNGSTSAAIIIDGCGYTVTTNRPIIAQLPSGGNNNGVLSEIKNLVIEGTVTANAADFADSGAFPAGQSIAALVGKANGGIFKNIG